MANRVMLFVVFTIMLTLFVPATRVEEHMLGSFGTDFAKVRTQGLALFGLPIKIPRRARPTTTRVTNSNATIATPPADDVQAADLVLELLERADLVQMVTMVPNPTATTTSITSSTATASAVITQLPSATPSLPTASSVPESTVTATLEVVAPTPEPQPTATSEPVAPTAVVLLPNSILDGFRSRMPAKGYWWDSADGVYIAIGSFKYQKTFFGNDAESYQKFVTFSITIRNERAPGAAAITLDPTNMTLIDIDGRRSTVHRDYKNLDSALLPNTIAPGQSDGGQLVFVAQRYTAPAQLLVTFTNADQPDVIHTQTIEFRVWPTVN